MSTKVTQRPTLAGTSLGPFVIFTDFMDIDKMLINVALLQKAVYFDHDSLLIGSFRLYDTCN
jgi:hypothetical protein